MVGTIKGSIAAVYELSGQASFRHLMAFSFSARTVHAYDRHLAIASLLRLRGLLLRLVACEARRSAGVLHGPGRSPGQPSIRVASATDAITLYLVRLSVLNATNKSPPIERTVPLQVTRRHNGDSLRLASPLLSRPSRHYVTVRCGRSHGPRLSHGRWSGCFRRMTPCRGRHVQTPVFPRGTLG